MQVHPSGNYISMVKASPKHTSLPFMVATLLATHLIVVLQPFGYSVFYGGRYSYSTRSSMTELPLLVSQH